jgi:hypothetical protein
LRPVDAAPQEKIDPLRKWQDHHLDTNPFADDRKVTADGGKFAGGYFTSMGGQTRNYWRRQFRRLLLSITVSR